LPVCCSTKVQILLLLCGFRGPLTPARAFRTMRPQKRDQACKDSIETLCHLTVIIIWLVQPNDGLILRAGTVMIETGEETPLYGEIEGQHIYCYKNTKSLTERALLLSRMESVPYILDMRLLTAQAGEIKEYWRCRTHWAVKRTSRTGAEITVTLTFLFDFVHCGQDPELQN